MGYLDYERRCYWLKICVLSRLDDDSLALALWNVAPREARTEIFQWAAPYADAVSGFGFEFVAHALAPIETFPVRVFVEVRSTPYSPPPIACDAHVFVGVDLVDATENLEDWHDARRDLVGRTNPALLLAVATGAGQSGRDVRELASALARKGQTDVLALAEDDDWVNLLERACAAARASDRATRH